MNRKPALVLLALALAFALWGPKLYGYLDMMVLVPTFIFLVLAVTTLGIRVPRDIYAVSALIALTIVVWVSFSILINGATNLQGVLRSIRALVTLLVLFPVFYFAAQQKLLSMNIAFRLLTIVLFINTLAIYAQVLYVPLQDVMAPIWGFDKPTRNFRAFGLTAGYDSAGFLAALLAASALSASLILRSWRWFLFFIVCAGAVGFTSRSSMVLLYGLILTVFFVSKSDWRNNGTRLLVLITTGVSVFVWYMLPRISSGVLELTTYPVYHENDYSLYFAKTSLFDVLEKMVVFPKELGTWVIGNGLSVPWSDVGYVKVVYLGGIPLLALMFLFYGYLFFVSRAAVKLLLKSGEIYLNDKGWARVWLKLLLMLLLVMVFGNLKNLYFSSRGYHEIFIISSALMLGFCKGQIVARRANGIDGGYRSCGKG